MKKPIIVLTGPTAVGKTEISIELAKAAGGEIISADSMQVYKQMDIGTAKIKKEQMQGVTHYMIDEWNPDEEFNVMIFQKRVKEIMEDIYNRGKIPILVGGTGFYIQAVLNDIAFTKEKQGDEKVDMTTEDASITNSTSVMMTTVAGDENAIGYISLGSLNDTVKAVKIDGAEATTDNVSNGTYKVARPFNIVTKDGLSEVAADFVKYIMSEDGQKVVEDNGYISQGNAGAFKAAGVKGKINIAGSSSVTPVMEKLKEAYVAVNPDVQIEVQQSDSTTGMTSAAEGVCDIGMASRELKDSELSAGLTPTVIAIDGIAVVVNKNNDVDGLTSDQVKSIYTGSITKWSEVK